MIELRRICKSFDGHQVLNDLSLQLANQESICVIGTIGSGKSTLMRCIAGLVEIDRGEIIFPNGQKPRVGMIFQHLNLFPFLNVLHNLTLAPMQVLGLSKEEAERIALEQLESVGLLHKRDNFPNELSAGQQQRVAIARALVMRPQILLLDEPFSALDPIATGEVMDVLRKLKREVTLIITTHNIAAASELVDKIVVLDKGCICESGTVNDILQNPRQEATRRLLSYISDLHYSIESPQFDRPELNARIEQYCMRIDLSSKASRYVQLVVEESLNIISLDRGAHLQLSKQKEDGHMVLDISSNNSGTSYIDPNSCRDDLSLSLLQGLCENIEERIEEDQRILRMVLRDERLV